jgi:hypothetical protein
MASGEPRITVWQSEQAAFVATGHVVLQLQLPHSPRFFRLGGKRQVRRLRAHFRTISGADTRKSERQLNKCNFDTPHGPRPDGFSGYACGNPLR